MLFFLGLDSEFALLETVLTAVYDGFPRLRNHKVGNQFEISDEVKCNAYEQ